MVSMLIKIFTSQLMSGYAFVYSTPCIINRVKSAKFQLDTNLLPLMLPHLNIDAGNPFLITFKISCSASHLVCP